LDILDRSRAFFNKPFHPFALLPLTIFLLFRKDRLKTIHVSFGLLKVFLEARL
jgi:hypothetical protein